MGYKLELEKANKLLEELRKEYKIYAPKRYNYTYKSNIILFH